MRRVPTGLVLFGGYGSRVMLKIVERLERSDLRVQLILLCGRNQELAAALENRKSRLRYHVQGFTSEVPAFMHLSDFFIGKPGPGSISEALQQSLPVIVDCNQWTLPQERYNARWVLDQEVGLVLRSFRQIAPAVSKLLDPETFRRLRQRVCSTQNRAVFEVPGFLERAMQSSGAKADS